MNADTSLLLTTVLREQPCVDTTLQATVQSVPFAVKCIAHQAYYTLYLISVVRALLNDEPSAYVYLIHRLQELDELQRDVQLGRAALVTARSQADTVIGAQVEQTGNKLEVVPNVPAGAERVLYALSDVVAAVPRVAPASSLELRVTLVGSGTVGHCLLQTLLDDHPRLHHPNRITVITRQPERLSAFAARGVLCVDRKHGRRAICQCDVLILALQGHQVLEFTKEHFATKLPGADLDPPAVLASSCLVYSCVAGMPTAKLASLLSHPEKLIVRPEVPTPGPIEQTARAHEGDLTTATDLLIQSMADHDSFLRTAVVEAEDIRVLHIADAIVSQDLATSAEKRPGDVVVNVPVEVARRRAVAAATVAAKAPYAVPRLSDVLLREVPPPVHFLTSTWNAVRLYASAQLTEARLRDHKPKPTAAQAPLPASGSSSSGGGSPYGPKRGGGGGGRSAAASAEASESDGAFLCIAFAALPSTVNRPLARATLRLHGAPDNTADALTDAASTDKLPGRAGTADKENPQLTSATASAALKRRMPDLYGDSAAVARDLVARYMTILRDEA